MTDAADFLRAILESPEDDAPRLAFADFMEEQGGSSPSELIRVQCEMARLKPYEMTFEGTGHNPPIVLTAPRRVDNPRYRLLRRREQKLLEENGMLWSLPVASIFSMYDWDHEGGRNGDEGVTWLFRRGFIESITLPTAAFMKHAGALFTVQPIQEVRLADKRPEQYDHIRIGVHESYWRFFDGSRTDGLDGTDAYELPEPLWNIMTDCAGNWQYERWQYLTEEQAMQALSKACVVYGQQQAKRLLSDEQALTEAIERGNLRADV